MAIQSSKETKKVKCSSLVPKLKGILLITPEKQWRLWQRRYGLPANLPPPSPSSLS